MNKKNTFGKNFYLIIIVIVLALLSGFLGAALNSSALYSTPFSTELNLSQGDYDHSSLVIRDAKKVIVSQDVKVQETSNQARKSLVGLFAKQIDPSKLPNEGLLPVTNYYQLDQQQYTGLILSADGWVMLVGDKLANLKNLSDNYVVITQDREIYEIDKQIEVTGQPILLAHLSGAQNLSPVSFMKFSDVNLGDSFLALDWQNQQILTSLVGLDQSFSLVRNSEDFLKYLILADTFDDNFKQPLLFNLNGEVVAFLSSDQWVPFSNYSFIWHSALTETTISLPILGVNYINLGSVAEAKGEKLQGALIYPDTSDISVVVGSPAAEAGLKAGDIIRAVDSIELNEYNDLSTVLSNYQGGNKVDLTIATNGVLEVKSLTLGSQE